MTGFVLGRGCCSAAEMTGNRKGTEKKNVCQKSELASFLVNLDGVKDRYIRKVVLVADEDF